MIKIKKDACIGCGACPAILPEIFEFDDDGLAEVKKPDAEVTEEVKEAVNGCPTDAIIIEKIK